MSTLVFPIQIDANGASVLNGGQPDAIRQNLNAILGTQEGSYGFDRSFGSRVNQLRFEQNNEVLLALLNRFIRDALKQEKRIAVEKIFFEPKESIVVCRVVYTIIQSSSTEELIYNFQRL